MTRYSNSLELASVARKLFCHSVVVDFNEGKTMARSASVHPTDGELEILRVLWSNGPTALSAVCDALRLEREVATTTVATMLRIMSEKGLVRRQGSGRGAQWMAVVTQKKTAKTMVGKLVDHVFDGSADLLAAHLIEGGQLSTKQLTELKKLIDQRSRTKTPNE